MKTTALTALVALLLGLPALAGAEVLNLPAVAANASDPALPAKGMTMAAVTQRYGAPTLRHAAVGGDAPRHPPITRWDYPGFAVVFERDHVVDAVRPDAPAPILRKDNLDR